MRQHLFSIFLRCAALPAVYADIMKGRSFKVLASVTVIVYMLWMLAGTCSLISLPLVPIFGVAVDMPSADVSIYMAAALVVFWYGFIFPAFVLIPLALVAVMVAVARHVRSR